MKKPIKPQMTLSISKQLQLNLSLIPKKYIPNKSALVEELLHNWMRLNIPLSISTNLTYPKIINKKDYIVGFDEGDIDRLTINSQKDYEAILKREA